MNENINGLTRTGYEMLRNELDNLLNVVRPQVLHDIETARAFGDLSENADYDAARNHQSQVEGRINEIEAILKNFVIMDEAKTADIVKLGCYVELGFENRPSRIYKIVGGVEADPLKGTISIDSPVAVAILKKKVGDTAIVNVTKPYKVEVLRIFLKNSD